MTAKWERDTKNSFIKWYTSKVFALIEVAPIGGFNLLVVRAKPHLVLYIGHQESLEKAMKRADLFIKKRLYN